jgi:hypothetical protein
LTDDDAQALLGAPVCAGGVRLGTVGAVWVDATHTALGVEVAMTWNECTKFVPLAAACVRDGIVSAGSFAFMPSTVTAFYATRGARRIDGSPGREPFRTAHDLG